MKELTDGSGGQIVIAGDMIPFSAYQAIYHKLTNKVEKISRDFTEPYIIEKESIENLHQRITQLIAQYQVKGSRCQITHSTKDSYSNTYSSFEKFSLMNINVPECTSSISYEFDFLVVLPSDVDPAKEIAQRYKLAVVASQDYLDEKDIRIPKFIRELAHVGGVQMHLEYSDYAVAQALEAAVNGWIKSLKFRKAPKFVKIALSLEDLTTNFADSIVRSVALLAGAYYLSKNALDNNISSSIVLFCLALGFFSYTVILSCVKNFYSAIRKFAPSATINITTGDFDRISSIDKMKSSTKGFVTFLLATILTSILINIFSSYIYNIIF